MCPVLAAASPYPSVLPTVKVNLESAVTAPGCQARLTSLDVFRNNCDAIAARQVSETR
jgi:hypothetical protein